MKKWTPRHRNFQVHFCSLPMDHCSPESTRVRHTAREAHQAELEAAFAASEATEVARVQRVLEEQAVCANPNEPARPCPLPPSGILYAARADLANAQELGLGPGVDSRNTAWYRKLKAEQGLAQ